MSARVTKLTVADEEDIILGTPLKKLGRRTISKKRKRAAKKRKEDLNNGSTSRHENMGNGSSSLFCSQYTPDEEDVLAQLLPALKKGPKTASELVHEFYRSSEYTSAREPAQPSSRRISSVLETVESVVELAPNVEQYENPVTPFSGGPQLPSWVDTCVYTFAKPEDIVSNSWTPLPEKAPYGLLLGKYGKEFGELMN